MAFILKNVLKRVQKKKKKKECFKKASALLIHVPHIKYINLYNC